MSKGRVTLTSAQISTKWNQNMKSSVPFIQQGIDTVTESPGVKAAAKVDKYVAGVQAAASNGKFAAGCLSYTVQEWKDRTKKKVGERLAGGVDAAMPKRQKFDAYLVPTINAILPEIASMPDMTLEDSMNRVRAMITHMANNPFKK